MTFNSYLPVRMAKLYSFLNFRFLKGLAPAIGLIQTAVFLGGTIVVFGKAYY